MVEVEKPFLRRAEVGQSSGNSPGAFDGLMRVSKMEIQAIEDPGRAQRTLEAAHTNMIDREWEEDVGIAKDIMIEEIARTGTKVCKIGGPGFYWNGNSEFVLFITFAS